MRGLRRHDAAVLCARCRHELARRPRLDALAKRHLSHQPDRVQGGGGLRASSFIGFARVPIDKATEYAAEDADVALRLWRVLKARLPAERMTTVYETLERPMVETLARMERRGIAIDRPILSRLSGEFAQEHGAARGRDLRAGGRDFNLGSPKQVGDILFGKMGLPGAQQDRDGRAGRPPPACSTTSPSRATPSPALILDWRQVSKLQATYTDALPGYIDPRTDRVHTSFALAATTTGRLSSSEPNLQNIPVRNEAGRKIRTAFVAAPGHKLLSADYSADRAAAAGPYRRHSAAEAGLRRRPRHPRHDGVGNVRRAGRGHAGRRAAPRQGDQFRHHLRHLGLRARQPARHPARGGRRLYPHLFRALPRHPRLHGRDQDDRAGSRASSRPCSAANATIRASPPRTRPSAPSTSAPPSTRPIQGSAADIIRRAMVAHGRRAGRGRLSARMLLQVHDELVFEVPEDEVDATIPVVRARDGRGAPSGRAALGAAAGRRARGGQLGRGALTVGSPGATGRGHGGCRAWPRQSMKTPSSAAPKSPH